jgi:hypothetical protein
VNFFEFEFEFELELSLNSVFSNGEKPVFKPDFLFLASLNKEVNSEVLNHGVPCSRCYIRLR